MMQSIFDGYKSNPQYALECLKAAERGRRMSCPCETNGGALPSEIVSNGRSFREVNTPLGIHTHNDSDLAGQFYSGSRGRSSAGPGTMNGFGERCGNANLCSVIPNLQLKAGYLCIPEDSDEFPYGSIPLRQ